MSPTLVTWRFACSNRPTKFHSMLKLRSVPWLLLGVFATSAAAAEPAYPSSICTSTYRISWAFTANRCAKARGRRRSRPCAREAPTASAAAVRTARRLATGPRQSDLEDSTCACSASCFAARAWRCPGCGAGAGLHTWLFVRRRGPLRTRPNRSTLGWRGACVSSPWCTRSTTRSPARRARAGRRLRLDRGRQATGSPCSRAGCRRRRVARLRPRRRRRAGARPRDVGCRRRHALECARAVRPSRNLTTPSCAASQRRAAWSGSTSTRRSWCGAVRRCCRRRPSGKVLGEMAGVEHVAIGRISKGVSVRRRGFRTRAASGSGQRAREAGLGEAAVRKLFSENALRVLCRSGK